MIKKSLAIKSRDLFKEKTNVLKKRLEAVMKWAGIEDDNVAVKKGLNLVTLNDDGKTFKQIARYIEKHL